MNCQEALELLYDYIDKEVSEIDGKQIKEHISNCKQCFDKFSLEKNVNDFIEAKLKNDNPQVKLDSLKSRIMLQMDVIDCQAGSKKNKRFNLTAISLAAAASLVILIAASFFASDLVRHVDIYSPLEQAHFSFVDASPDSFDKTETFLALSAVKEKFGYDVLGMVENFILSGGNFEEIMGVNMAHFLYVDNGHRVSVFVAPVGEFEIPEDLKNHKTVVEELTLYDHHCRGCRLVYHRNDSAIIITATNDEDIELLKFIPGYSIL